MPSSAWVADGWRSFPVWSIDMEGESQQPLTIQWAGSVETLDTYLLSNGWQRPPALNGSVFLKMLSPDTKIEELPVCPLHDGRFDSLILIREHNGRGGFYACGQLIGKFWRTKGLFLWVR